MIGARDRPIINADASSGCSAISARTGAVADGSRLTAYSYDTYRRLQVVMIESVRVKPQSGEDRQENARDVPVMQPRKPGRRPLL